MKKSPAMLQNCTSIDIDLNPGGNTFKLTSTAFYKIVTFPQFVTSFTCYLSLHFLGVSSASFFILDLLEDAFCTTGKINLNESVIGK
jgi:hypothetical protein